MSKRCMGCMENYPDELNLCPYCGYVEGTPPEEAVHMEPGSLLRNRYIIGKVLGYGGFGVTYIAWDAKLEQKVAIKEYMPSEFSTRMPGQSMITVFNGDKSEQFADGMNKFIDEAKRLAKFQNQPGIVKVYDSFNENGTAYIIMEFLKGETLTERLKRVGTIPEDEAVEMLWPVMESLKVVHEEGILHRDIAPDNIFITDEGEVKLIDFGASRYATTSHSRSLTVIVKQGYSPEEQYRSRGDQGPHTDVYALAATLYKMITGKTPPDAMERRVKCESQKKDIIEDIHKLNKNISEGRENAIMNALNVQIEDRTPDIQQFMDELNADPPVKRRYGKIKKIDLYNWPKWLKITVPTAGAAIVTFAILLLTGVINFASLFSEQVIVPENMVVVPEVEGMGTTEALELIKHDELLPSPDGNVESEYVEAGKILLQTPAAGAYLEKNQEVKLVVSSGGEIEGPVDGISTVPYVIWDTQENAVAKLAKAGLGEPIIETRDDDDVPAGMVISQSVNSGEKVPEGTQITIVVSTGKPAFDIPNVTGRSQGDAESTLRSKGLVVSVSFAHDDNVKEGNVISQNPGAGSKAKKGDRIEIVVSSGKEIITVPNVVGKSQDNATSDLKNQSFGVNVLHDFSNSVAEGNVISQTPAAGTGQVKGTTVTIIVSKGKSAPSGWTDDDSFKDNKWYRVETKTLYRSKTRTRHTETREVSNNSDTYSEQGWTTDSSTFIEWVKNGGEHNNGKTSVQAYENATTKRTVSTYDIWEEVVTGHHTEYLYYTWASWERDGNGWRICSPVHYSGWNDDYHEHGWSTSETTVDGLTYKYYSNDAGQPGYTCNDGQNLLWFKTTRNVEDKSNKKYTGYKYQDWKAVYKHNLSRVVISDWSNWSTWGDAAVTQNEDTQVETKTVYRYVAK